MNNTNLRQQAKKLIPLLKQKAMTGPEIIDYFKLERNQKSYHWCINLIVLIGETQPVYEPLPYQFKILTDEGLTKEQERIRRIHNAQRQNLAKATN